VCVLLGFELRASHLVGSHSTTWAMLPPLFSLVIFDIGSHFLPRLNWNRDPPCLSLPHSWANSHVSPHPDIGWDGILWTICPSWPQIAILLISASQVAKITGLSQCPGRPLFLSYKISLRSGAEPFINDWCQPTPVLLRDMTSLCYLVRYFTTKKFSVSLSLSLFLSVSLSFFTFLSACSCTGVFHCDIYICTYNVS
jgi:hypothetical protein